MENANIFAMVVSVLAALGVAFFVWSLFRQASGSRGYLLGFAASILLVDFAGFFFWLDLPNPLLGLGLAWLGMMLAAAFLFTFSLAYTRRGYYLRFSTLLALFSLPLIFFAVTFFVPLDGLFRDPGLPLSAASSFDGYLMVLDGVYISVLLIMTAMLLFRTYYGTTFFRMSLATIVLSVILPLVPVFTGLVGTPITWQIPISLFFYSLSLWLIWYAFIRQKLLYLVPVSRDLVVEKMADGWLVVDMQNRILDLNPVAEEVVGSKHSAIGADISRLFSDWETLASEMGANVQLQISGRTASQEDQQYLDMHAMVITDRAGNPLGRLVSFRDVTEKRKAEESRTRAKDQMFSLTNSISSAASRTGTVDEFLHASVQDLVRAFRCQSSFVFLANDQADRDSEDGLLLAHQFGIPPHFESRLRMLSYADPFARPVIERREPHYIPDLVAEARVPAVLRESLAGGLLLVPMQSERNLVGLLGLARPANMPFRSDEIENICSSADQMASFISADRRRQLAIALSERKKLVRDLHDSVTQKLYGLLALTEAAEMGMESGSNEMVLRVLPRITENARQALKEMRLFLHELQPIELERDGLIAVLHQRLASVEGRADIQTSLVADDKILLGPEKTVALYYIATEALNNVLKHARAEKVTVKLHQGRMNVFMEIEDDGVGFDVSQEKTGHMGLRNMRYRAEQVGGRVKINSALNRGTQVTVTVARDLATKSS